ncbi:MAG: hypothetical protein ACFFCW_16130 [Candidatus Hodarchaeota archaeon]
MEDLLLAKLQIHEITDKDIKDLIVLLRAHKLGNRDDKEVINLDYVSIILSDDWSFWFDLKNKLGEGVSIWETVQKGRDAIHTESYRSN